jgi:hypothetical protein
MEIAIQVPRVPQRRVNVADVEPTSARSNGVSERDGAADYERVPTKIEEREPDRVEGQKDTKSFSGGAQTLKRPRVDAQGVNRPTEDSRIKECRVDRRRRK